MATRPDDGACRIDTAVHEPSGDQFRSCGAACGARDARWCGDAAAAMAAPWSHEARAPAALPHWHCGHDPDWSPHIGWHTPDDVPGEADDVRRADADLCRDGNRLVPRREGSEPGSGLHLRDARTARGCRRGDRVVRAGGAALARGGM